MARTWLSIQIELIDGGGQTLWPRPGRIFAAARSHTFAHLATAIDDAFARWDRAHLHMFDLGEHGGLLIDQYWDDPPEQARLDETVRLGTLAAGQQFVYVSSTSAMTGHTCAPSRTNESTHRRRWASHRTGRCPTGAGGPSPTNTDDAGTVTTGRPVNLQTLS
ncbi:MAG: hypothetical protein ABIR82_06225 [Nocardioides sp.]